MDSLDDLRCKFWTLGREIFGGGEANLLLVARSLPNRL
jgi:hypothetical protein